MYWNNNVRRGDGPTYDVSNNFRHTVHLHAYLEKKSPIDHVMATFGLFYYRQESDIRCNVKGNNIVDRSDVVGASPVGASPTTSSFST